VWSIMQEKVYQHRINDIDELRQCIMSAWNELDQQLTRQSGSGELVFTLASRRKAATLNTACMP